MIIKEATFAGGSTNVSQKPKNLLPEFAFIGRSNVGKSSLINCLCGRRNLAHTSSTPGKTREVNHFLIDGKWYLVDLPGYGYAKMSRTGREKLEKTIDNYVTLSKEMVLLFVLIDSRLSLQKIDLDFLVSLGERGIPFSIIYTKCDKSGVNVLASRIAGIEKELLEYWETLPPCFRSSSETGAGKEEILSYIDSILKIL